MLARSVKAVLADRTTAAPLPERRVVLTERDVMRVTVTGLPEEAIVIDLNRIGGLSGVGQGPWKQACDYLIVFHDGRRNGALFVELKRTLRDGATQGQEQLRRSLPILRYLETMCSIHFGIDESCAKTRYALIAERGSHRLDKQRVRASDAPQVESYKGIRITTVIGERVAFRALAAHG